jgi:hypothetical protein
MVNLASGTYPEKRGGIQRHSMGAEMLTLQLEIAAF